MLLRSARAAAQARPLSARPLSSLAQMTPGGGVHGTQTNVDPRHADQRGGKNIVRPMTPRRAPTSVAPVPRAPPQRSRWRNKPLLRVHGEELFFKTGTEAMRLLVNEASRRDSRARRSI